MRNELEKYITDDKKRFTFTGILKRYSINQTGVKNYLFENIKDIEGNTICNHLWSKMNNSQTKKGIKKFKNKQKVIFEGYAYYYTRLDGTQDCSIRITKILNTEMGLK